MTLLPYKAFRMGAVCFLGGLFISPFLGLNGYFVELLFVALLLLGSGVFWEEKRIIFVSILFLGLSWGVSADFFASSENFLPTLVGDQVELAGAVVSFPEQKKNDRRVFFQVEEVCENNSQTFLIRRGGCRVVQEKILLVVPHETDIDYGQRLQLIGKLTKPRSFRDFDYAQYLERFGVKMILKNPSSLSLIDSQAGNRIIRMAKRTRNFFELQLRTILPEPHSTLVMGILLGVKQALPADLAQDFRVAGLQHVLVVSGSNVSFVVLAVALLCMSLGRWVSFIASVLAVIFFVFMTGADPPVLRAALMGGLVALSSAMGRFSDGLNVLLFSAIIIGLFSPQMVQADLGFLLSFSATLGIIVLVPILNLFLKSIGYRLSGVSLKNNTFKKFRLVLAVLLSAQIGVFPVVTLFFHEFSLWTIPANVLVEPLIPLIMIFGLISILVGVIFPLIMAKFFSIPTLMLTQGLIWIGEFFGQFEILIIPAWFSWVSLVVFLGVCGWAFFSKWYEQLQVAFEREVYGHMN